MSKRTTEGFDLSLLARDCTPREWGNAALNIHRVIADEYYSSKGYSSPSVSLIAYLTGASRASIFRTIELLQEHKFWTVEPGSGTRRSRYFPNIPALEALQAERRSDWCEQSKAKRAAVMEKALALNLEEVGAHPEWLAVEEDTPVPLPSKPVEAPVTAVESVPSHSPQEVLQQPSSPLQTPVSTSSPSDDPYAHLVKTIERIVSTLGHSSRTKAERDLAEKFKPYTRTPQRVLEGMEILLAGAKETEKDIVDHLSLLIKSLPPHHQEVKSLPGWIKTFGGDNPAEHSKNSMSNSTSNSGTGSQSSLWGKNEDTRPETEKYADFL